MATKTTCDRCGEEFVRDRNYPHYADEIDLVFCPDCGKDAEDYYGKNHDPNEVYAEMISG